MVVLCVRLEIWRPKQEKSRKVKEEVEVVGEIEYEEREIMVEGCRYRLKGEILEDILTMEIKGILKNGKRVEI